MAKERARGVLYWDHVSFAPMPEYQPTIMTQNGSRAYITKVEKNETFIAIGKFLKKKLKKYLYKKFSLKFNRKSKCWEKRH